ncbi:hypothetical protein TRFO_34144 [Tritrichomonas foetus]|uniref:Uncharacterized protein n=1 Tax=Tritrichomonas foetus TaxID=1144522 RepID=A0A1J4JPD6_9EUKA|nr:hypothetical protein TRFO_34144 [Tritrichomonas foetus]|eukprot:OHS99379.1 hypothetical protein TRFO_34144 [Tritrichomonas foetus]
MENKMIFLLFSFVLSETLRSGFYKEKLDENQTNTYELDRQKFFLRYMAHHYEQHSNISIIVFSGETQSEKFYPESNRFYQFKGNKIEVHSELGRASYQILIADEKSCDDYVIALTLTNYINTSYLSYNQSRKVCYLFYEPDCDYRVNLDCFSNNRDTDCYIYSHEALFSGFAPVSCRSNSTCEATLSDGFLATVVGPNEGLAVLDSSTKVLAVKGQNTALSCDSYSVDYFDVFGIHELSVTSSSVRCQPAEESVLIAIVLVVVLVFVLFGGVLIYYKCRPNREAYESDEGVRRKKKLLRKQYRTSDLLPSRPVRNSEAGMEPRRDVLAPLC